MDVRALLAVLLVATPTAAAVPGAPLPANEAQAVWPGPFPLELRVPDALAELTIGVPVTGTVVVRTSGLAGQGLPWPTDREVHLGASLDSGDAAALEPSPVVLPAMQEQAITSMRFTPTRLGPLALHLDAAWELLPGDAALDLGLMVVKDRLAIEEVQAGSPDADYDLALTGLVRSGHLANERLTWRVEATHTPSNASQPVRWVAAEGAANASPEGLPWSAEVRAKYGAGRYAFTVQAGGPRLADATTTVETAVPEVRNDTQGADFVLDVDDAPTTLSLAADSVNDANKTKSPGTALVTRVQVEDANGLGDVERVAFRYLRIEAGERVLVEEHQVTGLNSSALQAEVEDHFATSPMKDGDYVAVVTADGAPQPSVERTFRIAEAKPTASVAMAGSAFPNRTAELAGTLVVRDANFGTGPLDASDIPELGVVELRVYKGSRQVTEEGWVLRAGGQQGTPPLHLDLSAEGTRTTRHTYTVTDGKGELTLPLVVVVPEGASSGSYRVSVVDDNSTLASAPFEVQPLPRITAFTAEGSALPGTEVVLNVIIAPREGLLGLEVTPPWGEPFRIARENLTDTGASFAWQGRVAVPLPWDDEVPATFSARADTGDGRVVHRPDGTPVNTRTLDLSVANAAPGLDASFWLSGEEVGAEAWAHPHVVDELRARAAASDDNALNPDLSDEGVTLEAQMLDWRGKAASFEVDGDFRPAAADLTIEALDAEPGRYTLRLRARDADGASATRNLTLNLGTHFRLALLVPEGGVAFSAAPEGGLTARLQVRSTGNAPAASLSVLAEGLPERAAAVAKVTLANGTLLQAPLVQGFARFEAAGILRPSEAAWVEVLLPDLAGVQAGRFEGRILVAGEAA